MCTIRRIEEFLKKWPDMEFGPAHIVLSDANLEDGHIKWCLRIIASMLRDEPWPSDGGDREGYMEWMREHDHHGDVRQQLEDTEAFLLGLLVLPGEQRIEEGDVICGEGGE